MKRIGMTELARAAGVSPSTVSRALVGNPRISRETAERVLRTASRLGYRPHTARTRLLALFLPGLSNFTYTSPLLTAIQREALNRGCRIELLLPDGISRMNERLFYGGIALGKMDPSLCPFPLVSINAEAEALNRNSLSVCSDDAGAVTESVRRFRAAGHSRIGFLLAGNPELYNNRCRIAAFRATVPDGEMEGRMEIVPDPEEVEAALLRLMKWRITALLYLVPSAVNPEKLMRRNGIRIGKDLSLIVWEMLGIRGEYRPEVLVAEQDFESLAFESLEQLSRSAAGKTTEKRVLVPYVFRGGGSIARLSAGEREADSAPRRKTARRRPQRSSTNSVSSRSAEFPPAPMRNRPGSTTKRRSSL